MNCLDDDQIRDAVQYGDELRRRLHCILRSRDMTPAELARRAGLRSANLIYNFMTGRSTALSVFSIRQICAALGMSMGEMLDDRQWQPQSKIPSSLRNCRRRHDHEGTDKVMMSDDSNAE